ncbi:right-handed parallel beta-helix repeat-containing protein [Candidatus Woesearchaeota archaeon]|nr:right-handed parallel beta-helix repeat-containing protein [Candidatus Woesearchaeota archaeon]
MRLELIIIFICGIIFLGCSSSQSPETPSFLQDLDLPKLPEKNEMVLQNQTQVTLPSGKFDESCSSLSLVRGSIIDVSNAQNLQDAVKNANSAGGDTTILLADGKYLLDKPLWIEANNLVVRSKSGDREKVVISGGAMSNGISHIFMIAADNVTIADLKIGEVENHAIQIHGELDADNVLIHNVHVFDTNEQMIKGSYDAAKTEVGTDNGIVECSLFEYTAGIGPQYYIGGIDVHNGKGWIVRNNIFKNIKSPQLNEDLPAEHAIHFWSNSQDTLVENNTIINCDRGIGFGLGDRGHQRGIIRNNHLYHDSSAGDVGIALENAGDVVIQDNIILFDNDYPNAIEYRFEKSQGITISGTKTNKAIKARNGGQAVLTRNEEVLISAFIDPAQGNFEER